MHVANRREGSAKRLAGRVYAGLDEAFRFTAGDSRPLILDISKPYDGMYFKEIALALKIPKEDTEDYFSGRMCVCYYTGHLIESPTYIIAMLGISDKRAHALGEEITHGEHRLEHQGRSRPREYEKKFYPATVEFIGFLGANYIQGKFGHYENSRNTGKDEMISDIILSENDLDRDHFIGDVTAVQLIETGCDVPYKDIFHAKNQREIWKIVNRILIPEIQIMIPEGVDKGNVMKDFAKRVQEMGMKARLELY